MTIREGTCAGVALASNHITIAVYDAASGQTDLAKNEALTATSEAEVLRQIEHEIRQLQRTVKLLVGVGLSIGGHISEDSRRVRFAPGLVAAGQDWEAEPVADNLESALHVPVVVENDVNCMCAYQGRLGKARGVANFLVVYLAPDVEGLGCGIVAGGRLVRGSTGGAGELGHIVIQPDGPSCRCGNRGCLEAMVAVDNFQRDINWGGQCLANDFAEGAALLHGEHHERAEKVFKRSGRYLGQGLANVVNILNPCVIVLGGPPELIEPEDAGASSSSRLFMEGLREAFAVNAFSSMARDCEVVIDRLDLTTAATGAALLIEEHLRGGARE